MALLKEIQIDNGMILNYHRIIGMNNIINDKTYITVGSYINGEQREKEQKSELPIDKQVFINYTIFDIEYNDEITPKGAYDYLKTTDMFKNSKDV